MLVFCLASCSLGEAAQLTCTGTYFKSMDNMYLNISEEDLKTAGFEVGDIITVTMDGIEMEMPILRDVLDNGPWALACDLAWPEQAMIGVLHSDFTRQYNLPEYEDEQEIPVTIALKEKNGYSRDSIQVGVLSFLNMGEDDFRKELTMESLVHYYLEEMNYLKTDELYPQNITKEISGIIYYDTLNDLLSALDSGIIGAASVTQSVAQFMADQNDRLKVWSTFTTVPSEDKAIDFAMYKSLSNDYSLMLPEDRVSLRDELNQAIDAMKKDGTLDSLTQQYIYSADGSSTAPVEFTRFDGEETIRFAVTGDVPPIDYIDPSGNPAGFNTAVLSEIGRRLGKNVELVQVYSSVGRSLALSSGMADAAFWTRNRNYLSELISNQSIAENMMVSDLPLKSWVALALESMMVEDNLRASEATVIGDLPDGMIATVPYFSDPNAIVSLK